MGKICSIVCLILITTSCISSLNHKKENTDTQNSSSNDLDLSTSQENDFIVDSTDTSQKDEFVIDPLIDSSNEEFMVETLPSNEDSLNLSASGDGFLSYQTKENDTLMLIAFNIYGDYRKWHELAYHNKDVLKDGHDISHMPIIRYKPPVNPYQPPSGKPYLIKSGDSLTLISDKVYGDYRKWDYIYKNNQRQIRDPKLIFPGFTLYYPNLLEEQTPLH